MRSSKDSTRRPPRCAQRLTDFISPRSPADDYLGTLPNALGRGVPNEHALATARERRPGNGVTDRQRRSGMCRSQRDWALISDCKFVGVFLVARSGSLWFSLGDGLKMSDNDRRRYAGTQQPNALSVTSKMPKFVHGG